MTDNLDKLIEEYSQKLMTSIPKEQLRKSSINTPAATEEIPEAEVSQEESPSTEENLPAEETQSTEAETGTDENITEAGAVPQEESPQAATEPEPINTDPENFSNFFARVFTAGGAYALENAKVTLYRGDILNAFLTTDENGETKRIKIESYPEENSLEPLSDEQRLNYSADVSAEGFTEKKGLLVSAVGGADIVLNVELTPESEGIN